MQKEFSRKATLAAICTLAWPTMLEHVLETAVSYVDAAMVGRIGPQATAAVGATMTVNWLIYSSVAASSVGFLSYISHELGAKRPENGRRAAAQACSFVLFIGILLTALALSLSGSLIHWMHIGEEIAADARAYFFILYLPMLPRTATVVFGTCLRASGDTKSPLRVNILVNLINIVLNFFLIYPARTAQIFGIQMPIPGAGMGVIGAAIASAAATLVGGIGMTAALLRSRQISPRGCSLKPDREILKPCMRVTIPCTLQRFVTSFGYVAFASMINGLGTISIAAHSIANTAESAFYIPGYGMQTAAATLAGNSWGANDKERMRRFCRMLIALEAALMACSGLALFLSAPSLMRLFTADGAVLALGTRVLRMVAVIEPIFGIAIILEGIFQGVGDTKAAFCFNLLGMWGIRILGTYICIHHFGGGLEAAWGCMIAHNILLGALLSIRYLRGRWNPLNRPKGETA